MSMHLELDAKAQARVQRDLERGMSVDAAIRAEARRTATAPGRRAFKGIMPRKDAARLGKGTR